MQLKKIFDMDYKKATRALLEGLQCQHVDLFLNEAKSIKDFSFLGLAYYKCVADTFNLKNESIRVEKLIQELKDSSSS